MRHQAECRADRSNRCGKWPFLIVQDGGVRRLGFLKLKNYTYRSHMEGQYPSPCQILCR